MLCSDKKTYFTGAYLDHILVEGDSLYKSFDTSDMLSANQLSEFVKMFIHNIPVQYGRL